MTQLLRCILPILVSVVLISCQSVTTTSDEMEGGISNSFVELNFEHVSNSAGKVNLSSNGVEMDSISWIEFELEIPQTGRYKVELTGSSLEGSSLWLEDYIHNQDERTYDVTGRLRFHSKDQSSAFVVGSPLAAGKHALRLHNAEGESIITGLNLELIKGHINTPDTLIQLMEGDSWSLVWSDEFNSDGLPDSSNWSYNIGNWGWGNNELQFYEEVESKNARCENGSLVIQAHMDEYGQWSSARLTTQERVSFLYGKIDIRAKVPVDRGTWSAGWMLGDAYRDELSWPYCGEIDILECVGYEINDTTGSGYNHATCHTKAYYFKQNNQIGSQIKVDSMDSKFHTYTVEWYPDRILGYLDGEHYYTYDKNANDLEWPFHQPQNIILNLAIGGGWGGLKGIDPSIKDPKYIIDYVRVYGRE